MVICMKVSSEEPYLTLIEDKIPFEEYIERTRQYIKAMRSDIKDNEAQIMDANSPFELLPTNPIKSSNQRIKYGALLIHGLLDSPFSLKDIGLRLQQQGIFSRAVLLPGHGTKPAGLLDITYQQWLDTVLYGILSFKNRVDELFLIGYSTGAALSLYHMLQNYPLLQKELKIAGLVMLCPAIKIKAPVNALAIWHKLINGIKCDNSPWFYKETEVDYAKYRSIAYNAVLQVAELTDINHNLGQKKTLDVPILMVLSREDDTISSHKAIQFFSRWQHPHSKLLLYSKNGQSYTDPRIITRSAQYPDLNIYQFSHVSIPFTPTNHHYGQHGDFIYASHINNTIYGAYNRLESHAGDFLYDLGLLQRKRHELTYNPDFEFMMQKINDFILQGKAL